MSHEVELKFDVAPEDVEALRTCPSLAAETQRVGHYETRYFDTKDGALRGAGFSLRVRRSGDRHVQTVKRKRGSAAGLFVRQEWEADVGGFDLNPAALKSPALNKLLATIDPKALKPLIRTSFRRTSWLIAHQGSRIEVVLDEGVVTAGKAETPLCELELELKHGKPRALFDLAAEIGGAVALRLGVLSKAERGYALVEGRLARAAKAETVQIAAPLSEGDAFRAVAQACLRQYRLNEIVLLAGPDADALHQARIALRRLRTALSLFRPTVRGKEYQLLREELGWLAGRFGEARNVDVLLAGRAVSPDHDPLHPRLTKARAKAYARVAAALASERARSLMLRLALWVELGPWRFRERAMRDVAPLAAQQLERQWRKVRRHSARIAKLEADARHRLRLDVKKLRYTAEFLAGPWTKKPKAAQRDRFIAALKDLQARLGDMNDAEVAAALTARFAPGLAGSADAIRRRALAGEGAAASEDARGRAAAAAGYWL